MARSTLTLKIEGEQDPPAPYLDQVRALAKNINLTLVPGLLDNQFNKLLAQEGTVTTGAPVTVNLSTALDRYGAALGLSDVALLYVSHTGTAGTLQVNAAAVSGFTNLLGTAANLTLSPGDFVLVGALDAGNLAVTPANCQITLSAVTADADYSLHVWGRA